jgi:hypothetical protein
MRCAIVVWFRGLAAAAMVCSVSACAGDHAARKPDAPPANAVATAHAAPAQAQPQAAPAKPAICDAGNTEHEVAEEILSRSGRGLLWLVVPDRSDPDVKAVMKRGAAEVKSARALAECLLRRQDAGFDAVANKGQDAFDAWLDAHVGAEHAETLLAAGTAWFASMLVADSWIDAALDVPAAKSLLQRATAANPQLADGLGPLILGAYECFIPKAVGGKPEIGLKRLEAAASNPGSLQLAMKVAQAELCAYALQDRALFTRLLDEVEQSPKHDSTFDMLAKQRAKTLRTQADDMFPDID